ncbi:hypothetical protein CV102_09075 [Natronococcus pandeyae]|uniref:CARDB domain-containing protein n=1 Tax=Natronococcus pandeyae TaxID=2055836 RepID=A0A8J8Q4D8_9EURY|nr:hypothetical protein CV102_09075 [Natronococcus pandeyae]
MLATGTALVTGSVLVAGASGEEEQQPDENDGDEPDENGSDEPDENLELEVDAPEAVPYEEEADPTEDAADFDIEVTNRGPETTEVEVSLEIGPIDEPVFLELEAGECDTAHYGVMSRDLGVGEHDWTVTANDETETGTLTVYEEEQDC